MYAIQVKFPDDRRKFTYLSKTYAAIGATVEVPPTPGYRNTRAEVVEHGGKTWSGRLKTIVRVVPSYELSRERCCCCRCKNDLSYLRGCC